jgi:hypothetical protein
LSNRLFSCEIVDARDLFCDKDSNLIDIDSTGLKNDVEDVIFNSKVETVNQVNDEVKKISICQNCDDLARGYGLEDLLLLLLLANVVQNAITSLSHIWMLQCESNELSFDKILSCPEACEALSDMSVKKL